MKFYVIFLVFAGLTATRSQDSENKNAGMVKSIERVVSAVMKCWSVPGLSLVVVQEGNTVLKRGYGVADLEKGIGVTGDTIFSLASMSKQMSTTLLAILLEERGIPWRTLVKDIVPGFEMPSDYMTLHTTLEDIVSHRTGVRHELNDGKFSREQAYERIKYLEPVKEFREEILYSGVLFSVVAKVSETLGGKSWEQLMAERVFQPLGMTSATFYDAKVIGNDSFAKPYRTMGDRQLEYVDQTDASTVGASGPAGSIMASTKDMEKYVQFLLRGGKNGEGTPLLSQQALQELFSPLMVLPQPWLHDYLRLPVADYERTLDAYAHGWMLGYYREVQVIHHYGGLYGYNGLISLIPERSSAIYTAINGPSNRAAYMAIDLLQAYIADVILGLEPWLDEQTVCSYPSPWGRGRPLDFMGPTQPPVEIDKTIPPPRPLSAYVGTYGHFAYGNLSVFINGTDRVLQLNYGPIQKFKLYPAREKENGDKFNVETFGHMLFLERDLSTKYNPDSAAYFGSNEAIDKGVTQVALTMYGDGEPIVFRRDLKLADATKFPRKSDCV